MKRFLEWLNDKPPPLVSRAVIHENGRFWPIDKEYAELGKSEGWIRLDGWHRDSEGILVYRYIQIE